MKTCMRRFHQSFPSDPARLADVRHALESFCAECGFDRKATGEIGLVVNEALANVIRHAYEGKTDGPVDLSAEFSDETLRIDIRDWGSGKDPTCCRGNPDPLTPGGLGLTCIRKMMDDARFTPQSDGMLLTMFKAVGRNSSQ